LEAILSDFFAALPMYEWPENRAEVDADWAALRARLAKAGIDAPEKLVRRNADLPAVPGGIRDSDGAVIAPDPATLPPDKLDFFTLWKHPKLLFAQTCWGPLELGLAKYVRVVGQPDYSAFEGGAGELYSSAIVMRRESPPLRGRWPEGPEGVGAELSGHPAHSELRVDAEYSSSTPPRPTASTDPPLKGEGGVDTVLHLLRNRRLAFNSDDSMSGIIALTRDLKAIGENIALFSELIETGGHRNSIVAVAEGRADVAAIDCRSWALAQRFEPRAAEVEVIGWTAKRKGLPFIAGLNSPLTHLPD
jgi:ABC-type phosphate/phosphonate transport system substrate-binding protein